MIFLLVKNLKENSLLSNDKNFLKKLNNCIKQRHTALVIHFLFVLQLY